MKSPHSETLVRKTSSQRSKVQATPNSRWSTEGRKSEQCRKRGREEERKSKMLGCQVVERMSSSPCLLLHEWKRGTRGNLMNVVIIQASHQTSVFRPLALFSLLSHPITHKWLRVRANVNTDQKWGCSTDCRITMEKTFDSDLCPLASHVRA